MSPGDDSAESSRNADSESGDSPGRGPDEEDSREGADDGDSREEADDDDSEEVADDDDSEEEADDDDSEEVADGGTVSDDSDSEGVFTGAPDDEEMPLTEHIREMIYRLFYVILVMAVVSAFVFPFADDIINFLWYSFLPGSAEQCYNGDSEACPRVYHPLGLLLARLKVASLAGMIVALPVFVYQTYLFMRPGLYPNERRYYLASVPTSLVLALVGVAFAYFLILPLIFTYFLVYSEGAATIAFGLTDTFDLILLMMGLFAIVFQIPLFIMLAIMMGVTTRLWLEDKRILFWLGFGGVAFIFSPDPTGMAPLMVALTMIALFEMTLLLLRWTGR